MYIYIHPYIICTWIFMYHDFAFTNMYNLTVAKAVYLCMNMCIHVCLYACTYAYMHMCVTYCRTSRVPFTAYAPKSF